MANIMRGSASREEIEAITGGKPLTVVYAKDADNPRKDGDYPFSSNISHPETGEILRPVKGYCTNGSTFGRPCYYAEFNGKSGTYYYIDETKYTGPTSDPKTIRAQIEEDRKSFLEKYGDFDSLENTNDNTSLKDDNATEQTVHNSVNNGIGM